MAELLNRIEQNCNVEYVEFWNGEDYDTLEDFATVDDLFEAKPGLVINYYYEEPTTVGEVIVVVGWNK